jgi:hypothetical protein
MEIDFDSVTFTLGPCRIPGLQCKALYVQVSMCSLSSLLSVLRQDSAMVITRAIKSNPLYFDKRAMKLVQKINHIACVVSPFFFAI